MPVRTPAKSAIEFPLASCMGVAPACSLDLAMAVVTTGTDQQQAHSVDKPSAATHDSRTLRGDRRDARTAGRNVYTELNSLLIQRCQECH